MSILLSSTSILIIGCGDVGNRLAFKLLNKGHKVWGLRRDTTQLAHGVVPIRGDLKSENSLGEWPNEPFEYVVYCASASEHSEEGYRQAYLEGMKHTLARLEKQSYPLKRLFFTSSTGVYHQAAGEWVDETSALCPERMTGKIMLATENIAIDSVVPSTIIRFGGIYGPGREYLIHRVEKGEGYTDDPLVYGNRIHSDDCAGILTHLIESDLAGKELESCYIGVDNCPAPLHDVTNWLANQLHVNISQPIEKRGRGSKRCSNQKIVDSGYHFTFPDYKAGYRSMLNE